MIELNIIFYFFIFIIGITCGSFFTLAVYRIPLKQDITHKRSYCPNCNHKLSFFDLIPVFSYLFLMGKCRYCGKKIRIRYLLLEILSGIVFVLFAFSINRNVLEFNTYYMIYFITGLLYISGLFIIAGIDKEKIKVQNEVSLFIIIIEGLYIIYLYILQDINIYRYVMYLLIIIVMYICNNIYLRKKAKNCYTIQCLIIITEMVIFTYELGTIITIILTLLAIALTNIITKLKSNKNIKNDAIKKHSYKEIPIVFYLCICNIISLIITNFLQLN